MGKRELIFFNLIAVVFGAIAVTAYVVCWPVAMFVRVRDKVLAWAESCGEAH